MLHRPVAAVADVMPSVADVAGHDELLTCRTAGFPDFSGL